MSEIAKAISTIMGSVGSVKKEGKNPYHNYKYATAADVLHKLQGLMANNGLIVFQSERERSLIDDGNVLQIVYAFTLLHRNGEVWPHDICRTGMSAARNSKGGFDDKAVNKCHTSAHKYFLITLFEIPTGDYDDADADQDKPSTIKAAVQKPMVIDRMVEEHDAVTGEIVEPVGPHIIDVPLEDEKPDWVRYGVLFVDGLKTAKDKTELKVWININAPNLDKMREEAPKVYERLQKYFVWAEK